MGGGLLQLSAYGSENDYLHGNPQITFFKTVYKRHTNFAMESIDVRLEGSDELSYTEPIKLKVKIPRNGDLISNMYLRFEVPDILSTHEEKFYWTKAIGLSIIDYVDIYIGGQRIERLYGKYLDITNQLSVPVSKLDTFKKMTGDEDFLSYNAKYGTGYYPGFNSEDLLDPEDIANADQKFQRISKFYESPAPIFKRTFNIPLNFWFVRNVGLSLPLIALQYHDVELEIQLKAARDLYTILQDDKTYYYYEDEKNLVSFNKKEDFVAPELSPDPGHYTPYGREIELTVDTGDTIFNVNNQFTVYKDDIIYRHTAIAGERAYGRVRFTKTIEDLLLPSDRTFKILWTNTILFETGTTFFIIRNTDQSVKINSSTGVALLNPDPLVTPFDNWPQTTSVLAGTAGSLDRIRNARERAAERFDINGKPYGGLKKYIPKLRIKPESLNKDHHISKFIYGKYSDKTWDLNATLDINYIFLDDKERRVFAEISHQYLIEKVIRIEKQGLINSSSLEIEAYHPVKEIPFVASRSDADERNEWLNYTTRESSLAPNTSSFDFQDHWWRHCWDFYKGISSNTIIENGPISFTHPVDGVIDCDPFQEWLFRFGPNGEAGDTATLAADTILGWSKQDKWPLYTIEQIKAFTEGSIWQFTPSGKIPKIANDDIEIFRENPLVSARMKFNGHIRQETRQHEFFNQVQPYQHHTGGSRLPIYSYSFALNPEKYQPSGACNFSKIKSFQIDFELKDTPDADDQSLLNPGQNIKKDWRYNVEFFVISYNVLKIMGGLGGLVFSE